MQSLLDYLPIILLAFAAVAVGYVAIADMRVWKRKLTSEIITLNPATPVAQ